jgi:hypothetical protein
VRRHGVTESDAPRRALFREGWHDATHALARLEEVSFPEDVLTNQAEHHAIHHGPHWLHDIEYERVPHLLVSMQEAQCRVEAEG